MLSVGAFETAAAVGEFEEASALTLAVSTDTSETGISATRKLRRTDR